MKKAIIAFVFMSFCLGGFSQAEFPFSEYFTKTHEEFIREGFKYDKKRNAYRKKQNSMITQNLVLAIFGMSTDIPAVSDFRMYVQGAKDGVAYINVEFYYDSQYVAMVKYLKDNGIHYTEVDLTKGSYISFEIDGVEGVLKRQMHIGTTSSKDFDTNEFYNSYSLSLRTGDPAWSPWYERQIKKHNTPYTVAGHTLTERERNRFPQVDIVSVFGGAWQGEYEIGSVNPMAISERVEFLSGDELRYNRINRSTGGETDIVMTYTVDGNCIRASYKHHHDGTVVEGESLKLAIYFRPAEVMWLVKNDNNADVKKLFAE